MKNDSFYFATANTGEGFVNFLNKINDDDGKSFQFIIKGGSGTGKSTMMKKIAEFFKQKKFSIEYYFCSTDTESLDGIRIIEKNISIVDGTSPHILDVNLSGVDTKIIDLGEFINCKILSQKKQLEKLTKQKKQIFDEIYLLLASAKNISTIEDNKLKYNEKKINKDVEIFLNKNKFQKQKKYSEKYLFLNSINNINSNLVYKNKYKKTIKLNKNIKNNNNFLKILNKILKNNKISHKIILNNLNPKLIDGIIVNNILIINEEKKTNFLIKKILNIVIKKIIKAKHIHQKIEEIYKPYVNFEKVNMATQNLINQIDRM